MSDISTLTDLVQTLQDGHDGYAKGAEKLAASDQPELAPTFRRLATQRADFTEQLRSLASALGTDLHQGGSALAAAHRGWMTLKDAVTGSGPDSVLGNAVRGDAHAVSEYEKALTDDALTPAVRATVTEQLTAIRSAHAEVTMLQKTPQ